MAKALADGFAKFLANLPPDTTDSFAVRELALTLGDTAAYLEPADAAATVETLTTEMAKTSEAAALRELALTLSIAASRINGTAKQRAAETIAYAIATPDTNLMGVAADPDSVLAEALRAVILELTPADLKRSRRTVVLAFGTFATPHGYFPLLHLMHPQPKPLPPQALVELLKHPFCVGEARRAVLDALAFAYNRSFADLWEFVEYAHKHHLDLLTPPKRPQP